MKPFKPMLACMTKPDLAAIPYPMYASCKMDGFRCIITPDGPVTRNLAPIPNYHLRNLLSHLPIGLDGELCVLKDGKPNFRATSKAVTSYEGKPEVIFYVFDWLGDGAELPYSERNAILAEFAERLPSYVQHLTQWPVTCQETAETLFLDAVADGYEGLIIRSMQEPYKFGRSTMREAGMLKCKPWDDAEARIVEILPEFQNTNEQTRDATGRAKRSSAKAGKVQREAMGKMLVAAPDKWPKPFEIGTGFTRADKVRFWAERNELVGRLVKFKYVSVGGYDVPRHAVFQGFRSELDV